MSTHRHAAKKELAYGKIAVAGLLTTSVGLLATAGVYAGLSATATGAEAVSSGSLNLTLSADVGVGFSNFTGKMAPGDTDNVYVNLNRPGFPGGSNPWKGWSHGQEAFGNEEVSA